MFVNNVKYRLVFNRKGKLNKEGKALIQIEAYLNKKKRYFSTGIYIQPIFWDDKRKVVEGHPLSSSYNIQIRELMKEMEKFEYQMREKHGYFDLAMFDDFFDRKGNHIDFWEMFEQYYNVQNVSKSRKMAIRRTIKYWKEYNRRLSFETFNLQTIMEFEHFLREKKGLHTNTILQHHKITKHFFNYLIKNDILNDNPYKAFKIKREKTEKVYLTEDELSKIENLEVKGQVLEQVRDMFLFSCYTGLRFSDVISLKPDNIEFTETEVNLIKRQEKTGDFVQLPISRLFEGRAVEILSKYYDKYASSIFPRITNQAANRNLKIIQGLTGIQKTLTFHIARHTFGTLLAKYTHDPYLIRQLMGHSDIQTSMTYIHLSNEMVKEKLDNVDWSKYLKKKK